MPRPKFIQLKSGAHPVWINVAQIASVAIESATTASVVVAGEKYTVDAADDVKLLMDVMNQFKWSDDKSVPLT